MRIVDIKRDLIVLGIDPSDYRVLKLLPLVYVAWADGRMEEVERSRLLELASRSFGIGLSGAQVLHEWLSAPPSHEYLRRALRDLLALARAPEEIDVALDELPALLAYAEGIARSTATALDAPWAVTAEEEAALAEIARLLNIDNGTSWATLLRELDSAQPSLPSPAMPSPLQAAPLPPAMPSPLQTAPLPSLMPSPLQTAPLPPVMPPPREGDSRPPAMLPRLQADALPPAKPAPMQADSLPSMTPLPFPLRRVRVPPQSSRRRPE
jgi:hypothetical protein